MHHESKDFVTALVPAVSEEQKESVVDFLCLHWNVSHVDFLSAERPEILLAHGVSDASAARLISRLVNSLGWQDERRLAVVSSWPAGVLSDGEQSGLLARAVENLRKKLPSVDIAGVLLNGTRPTVLEKEIA